MYKPAICSSSEDSDATHEEGAKAEIQRKRREFSSQFILAPFSWKGRTNTGNNLTEADRIGKYRNLWQGANLHSNDTLPGNIQQYLAPPKENNDTTTNNSQQTNQPTEERDPADIELDKLDAYNETPIDMPTAPTEQDNAMPEGPGDGPSSPYKFNSRKMYADSIPPTISSDTRATTDTGLKPNRESVAEDYERLLDKPIVAKEPKAHTERPGPRKGNDQDTLFLLTDPRRGKH